MRLVRSFGVLFILFSIAACTAQPADAPVGSQSDASNIVCMVTDTQGLGDRSFNDTAWRGVLQAQDQLGVEAVVRESRDDVDYAPNINDCLKWAVRLRYPLDS